MTESEAKKKWCPFTRVLNTLSIGGHSDTSFNRRQDDWMPLGACCIGSGCMAWRHSNQQSYDGGLTYKPDPESGYCALMVVR